MTLIEGPLVRMHGPVTYIMARGTSLVTAQLRLLPVPVAVWPVAASESGTECSLGVITTVYTPSEVSEHPRGCSVHPVARAATGRFLLLLLAAIGPPAAWPLGVRKLRQPERTGTQPECTE